MFAKSSGECRIRRRHGLISFPQEKLGKTTAAADVTSALGSEPRVENSILDVPSLLPL